MWKPLGAHVSTDNGVVVEEAEVIFIAVKPNVLSSSLKSIQKVTSKMDNKLFISIIAGCPLKLLEEASMFVPNEKFE